MEGRRQGGQFISHRPVTQKQRFEARKVVFSSEFFNSFASGCSGEQIPCFFVIHNVHDRSPVNRLNLVLYSVPAEYHHIVNVLTI